MAWVYENIIRSSLSKLLEINSDLLEYMLFPYFEMDQKRFYSDFKATFIRSVETLHSSTWRTKFWLQECHSQLQSSRVYKPTKNSPPSQRSFASKPFSCLIFLDHPPCHFSLCIHWGSNRIPSSGMVYVMWIMPTILPADQMFLQKIVKNMQKLVVQNEKKIILSSLCENNNDLINLYVHLSHPSII